MEAQNASTEAQTEDNTPAFIQEIIDTYGGEFVGKADDGMIGFNCDRVRSLTTSVALQNGYVVAEVTETTRRSDYNLNVMFKRLNF